jgi:hypothetical protein
MPRQRMSSTTSRAYRSALILAPFTSGVGSPAVG